VSSLQRAILIAAYLGPKCNTFVGQPSAALVNDKGKLEVTQNQRVLTSRPAPSGASTKSSSTSRTKSIEKINEIETGRTCASIGPWRVRLQLS